MASTNASPGRLLLEWWRRSLPEPMTTIRDSTVGPVRRTGPLPGLRVSMRSRSGTANRTYFTVAMLGLLASSVARADDATVAEPPITEQDRKHWAFKSLAEVAVPHVGDTSWPRGAIDEFVLEKLRAKGLEPSPEAD